MPVYLRLCSSLENVHSPTPPPNPSLLRKQSSCKSAAVGKRIVTHCSTVCSQVCCSRKTHWSIIQYTGTHCNTLQHRLSASLWQCVTLQHTVNHCTTFQ